MRVQTLQTIAALMVITFFFYLLASPESFFSVFSSLSAFSLLFSDAQNLFLLITYALILLLAGAFLFATIRYFKTRNTEHAASFEIFRKKLLYASFAAVFSLFLFSLAAFGSSYSPLTEYAANSLSSLMGNHTDPSSLSLSTALSKTLSELKKNVAHSTENLSGDLVATKSDFDKQIERAGVNVTGKLTEELKQKLANDGGVLSGNLVVKGTLDVLNESTLRDILPQKDDLYNLGSNSKGWNELFVNRVNGINGALQIGSASSSHTLNSGSDLLIGGNAEVNGTLYADGRLVLSETPTDAKDATPKDYVDARVLTETTRAQAAEAALTTLIDTSIGTAAFLQRIGTTISPKTASDAWDFRLGNLSNVGTLSMGTVIAGLWNGTAITPAYGGTGTTATPTNGQIPIGNGTGYTLGTITGTSNQVTVTNGSGTITLALPQSINTTSSPTFSALTLSNALTVGNGGTGVTSFGGTNQLLYTTATNTLSSISTGNNKVLITDGSGVPNWTNISSDTFTQYALLVGRSGGQTLVGGSGVTDVLNLQGTSGNGTAGNAAINLKVGNNGGTTAMTVLNNGSVGVGTVAPVSTMVVDPVKHEFL